MAWTILAIWGCFFHSWRLPGVVDPPPFESIQAFHRFQHHGYLGARQMQPTDASRPLGNKDWWVVYSSSSQSSSWEEYIGSISPKDTVNLHTFAVANIYFWLLMFGNFREKNTISEWTIDCLRMSFSCGTHGNVQCYLSWLLDICSKKKLMVVPKAVPQRSRVGMYVLMLQHSLHQPSRSFTIASHLTSDSWISMIDLHLMFGVLWRGSFTHYMCCTYLREVVVSICFLFSPLLGEMI